MPLSPMKMLPLMSLSPSSSPAGTPWNLGLLLQSVMPEDADRRHLSAGREVPTEHGHLRKRVFALAFLLDAFDADGSRQARSAMFGVPRMWHAMSPTAPQPNSGNPRHLMRHYAGLYGRISASPSHASQSSVDGTASSFGTTSGPCSQYPSGRFVHACTSFTSPMSPLQIISQHWRAPSFE